MGVCVCVFFLPALFDTVNSKKGSQKGQRGIIKTRFRRHTVEQNDSDVDFPPSPYADFLGRKFCGFQCSFLSRNGSQNVAQAEMLSRGGGGGDGDKPTSADHFCGDISIKDRMSFCKEARSRNPTQELSGLKPTEAGLTLRVVAKSCF
ncbi:UNVERIFIED_CONTAM: hypothetical protein K2H54_044557 [Gekko kuhli]